MVSLFYLFFIPIAATIIPYLTCSALDVPFSHGFFSIDIFIFFCLLLTPRKNIIWYSVWALLLSLFGFFYEQSFVVTLFSARYPQWSDFFCAIVYLAIVISAFYIPRNIKLLLPYIGILYLLLFLADAQSILHFNFNISLLKLLELAFYFIWGVALLISIPCLQIGLVLFFSKNFFTTALAAQKKPHPIALILLFLCILLLNWGTSGLQEDVKIISYMLKDFSSTFNDEEEPNKKVSLSPEFIASYPIYNRNDLHTVNDKYDKVVMILVESWGVPKNIDLLRASFQIFEGIPNSFIGLYPRKHAYTQGAEWEDFGIPTGEITDSILPKKYRNAGFETWFVHGYDKYFFKRVKRYPMYGFDSLLFKTDFSKRGLQECQYGYPGICDASLENWLEQKLEEPGKKFIYWTTLDAHYPYDTQILEKKSHLCKDFNLSKLACVFWTHEEGTLQSIAKLVRKFPNIRFIIRGDHRPMGELRYRAFLESFFIFWVPIITFN